MKENDLARISLRPLQMIRVQSAQLVMLNPPSYSSEDQSLPLPCCGQTQSPVHTEPNRGTLSIKP